jgi:hypothetical protein
MAKHKTHYEDCDVLVVGGGMAVTVIWECSGVKTNLKTM